MNRKFLFPLLIAGFMMLLGLHSCDHRLPGGLSEFAPELPSVVDFNFHIKPLLSDRCFKCHGPDANKRKGELRLDLKQEAFKKSKSPDAAARKILAARSVNGSELFHRIISDDSDYMMPPPESNLVLTDYEKALIAKWIKQGANYKRHWSFVAPEAQAVPSIEDPWINSDIDRFILKKILSQDLAPSAMADKATLLRRATLDITGLPPTPQEINSFLEDQSPDAYERKIDELLERPQYGERMAMEWMDVSRYADTHGYQDDGMRTTWPWRDWVIKAFNENLPYDQFITWQLAGDLLENPTKDQLLATCFNRNHPQSQEGGVVDEEYRVEYVADRTNTLGKGILGLTMECARCHDHKYDPISQKDYYSLFAYFNNNNESGIVPYNGEASPTVFLPTPEAAQKLDSLGHIIDSLSQYLVSEKYIEDFKKWADQLPEEVSLRKNYGLKAEFSFEKEVEGNNRRMNLDRLPTEDLPKKTVLSPSFINHVKGQPDAAIWGDMDTRPVIKEGKNGNGISFRGDAGIRFNRDLDFDRNQPFSVSIWVKPLRDSLAGPIFNNSNDAFEGYRGWLCKLNEDGTLSFQLNHVWPDNAIDIKTHEPLPVNEWSHIVMTYDGSSKAKGVACYVNGEPPAQTILKDKLYKSLLHGMNETNWTDFPFILGMGMTKSIEDLEMDELKVYNRTLSKVEVEALYNEKDEFEKVAYDEKSLLNYFLNAGFQKDYNRTLEKITAVRAVENEVATNEIEVMIMQERPQPRTTYLLDRGMYDQPSVKVEPTVPAIFAQVSDQQPKNRLELAEWLVHPNHPLTSRVAVNRIWRMLFGRGIVATQEDFGNQGNLPSHPELLDFLALKLIALDWDIKAFLKYVMTSSVYRQSSIPTDEMKLKDPDNDTYCRFPPHRLSAETIRDNALAASGLLVKKIGGPSVYPYQPPGLWEALATRNATVYKVQSGDSLYRRSLYTVWKRSSPPPSMMTFDAPDRYYCVVNRQETATPLQSLVLMNDEQFIEAARVLGQRMMEFDEGDPIKFAFQSLIGRAPGATEFELLQQEYEEGLETLKKDPESVAAWLTPGEFEHDPSLNKVELAAHTLVASTIMNFEEFVMKR